MENLEHWAEDGVDPKRKIIRTNLRNLFCTNCVCLIPLMSPAGKLLGVSGWSLPGSVFISNFSPFLFNCNSGTYFKLWINDSNILLLC